MLLFSFGLRGHIKEKKKKKELNKYKHRAVLYCTSHPSPTPKIVLSPSPEWASECPEQTESDKTLFSVCPFFLLCAQERRESDFRPFLDLLRSNGFNPETRPSHSHSQSQSLSVSLFSFSLFVSLSFNPSLHPYHPSSSAIIIPYTHSLTHAHQSSILFHHIPRTLHTPRLGLRTCFAINTHSPSHQIAQSPILWSVVIYRHQTHRHLLVIHSLD